MLMSASTSCLLVVDIQERLAAKVRAPRAVIGNAAVLLKAARRLDVPVLVSEQYPRGLGTTVPDLKPLLIGGEIIEKLHFSCIGEQSFANRFAALGRPQAVVAGMEAHVCVLQTVEDLLAVAPRPSSSKTLRRRAPSGITLWRWCGYARRARESSPRKWLCLNGSRWPELPPSRTSAH